MVEDTIAPEDAAASLWDILVVGAGPAGGLAAYLLASRGLRVLVVDKDRPPRYKVCGCSLNTCGISILKRHGLWEGLVRDTRPFTRFTCRTPERTLDVALHGGAIISRERLDTALLEAAIGRGAQFIGETQAMLVEESLVGDPIQIQLKESASFLSGQVLIWAAGLKDKSLLRWERPWVSINEPSPIGLGGTLREGNSLAPGQVLMEVSNHGYLGMIQLPDGRLNMAAAIWPAEDTPAKDALAELGARSGLATGEIRWEGVPELSRSVITPASERLFLVGDSSGYVEPFTGEGMSWALVGAEALAPIAAGAAAEWRPEFIEHWSRRHWAEVGSRQRFCRYLGKALRIPLLRDGITRLLQSSGTLKSLVARQVHHG